MTEGENSQKDTTKDSNEAGVSTKYDKEDANKDAVVPDVSDKVLSKSDSTNNDRKNADESDSSSKSTGDGNKVDSDVDELHLLEKLYSDNEYNSVLGSSDTGSPIAISDSSSVNDKTSSDERRTKKPSCDVISIENSSYSESEEKKEDSSKETEVENEKKTTVLVCNTVDENTVNIELECLNTEIEVHNGLLLEDILLASTDESDVSEQCCSTDPRKKRRKRKRANETCINLKDDTISIGDTLIIENRDLDADSETSKSNSDKNTISDGSSVEDMVIGSTEINSEVLTRLENIVEPLDEENTTKSASKKSPEANKDTNLAETTNGNNKTELDSVQSMDNKNLNEASENVKPIQDETPNQSIGDVSMDEVEGVMNTIENNENCNKDTIPTETKENDFEIKEGDITQNSNNTPTNVTQDATQPETTSTSKVSKITPEKATKDNSNTLEAMEVDSLETTL